MFLRSDSKSDLACTSDLRAFDVHVHQPKYTVAFHAIRGFDTAVNEYNTTFSEYLTATAGKRFEPAIRFVLKPMTYPEIREGIASESIDFFYADAGTYSCIGVEFGAQPLATKVVRLDVRGHTYDLDEAGGVMFTRDDNAEVQSLADFRGKVIGAGGVLDSLLQFNEMLRNGLSPVMDPLQVVFTANHYQVVDRVLSGEFDIGFVRADQLPRHSIESNKKLRVLHPQVHIMENGALFPLLHSTKNMYPEKPFSSLPHVPADVANEVQSALLALSAHAETGMQIEECFEGESQRNCTELLQDGTFSSRCDTTEQLSRLALRAAREGGIAGFRSPRSYHDVRTMQEDTGFLWKDVDGVWKCTHSESLFEGIQCPEGHYKFNAVEFNNSCSYFGLTCPNEARCFCRPCVESFEVEVFEWRAGIEEMSPSEFSLDGNDRGCSKMSLCGTLEQRDVITFRIIDHKRREHPLVEALLHLDQDSTKVQVEKVPGLPFTYELNWTSSFEGVALLQIDFNGEQIPESPIRIQVVPKDCDIDYPGQFRVASASGTCICGPGTVPITSRCIRSTIVVAAALAVVFLVLCYASYLLLVHRMQKNDTLWLIDVDELQFEHPCTVIGKGSFGVVLKAEYRGTTVAIKSGVKPKNTKKLPQQISPAELKLSSAASVDFVGDVGFDEGTDENEKIPYNRSSSDHNLEFLREELGRKKKQISIWSGKGNENIRSTLNESILAVSHSSPEKGSGYFLQLLFPCLTKESREREAFIREMRVLSRLRHPCITTVMGTKDQ